MKIINKNNKEKLSNLLILRSLIKIKSKIDPKGNKNKFNLISLSKTIGFGFISIKNANVTEFTTEDPM